MRTLSFALTLLVSGAPVLAAETTLQRVSRYYAGWFSFCPGTRISTFGTAEMAVPGYEAFRVERGCEIKNRNEMTVTLVDPTKNEIFVGDVLHSSERKGRPFTAADIPVLEGALKDLYGLPVSIEVLPGERGSLRPIRVSLQEAPGALARVPGFVSKDGASVLLGEFRSLDVEPTAVRERLFAESPGIRPTKGAFFVPTFIDFQCLKCRQRTPEVRDFVQSHGGALEMYLLPLVKVHDWSFAAAESAAALSNVSPSLYLKYEEALFPHAEGMTAEAARQLADDVAEAASVRDAFRAELSSGRARSRVLRDIELGLRLGLNGTPDFFYKGVFLSSEATLAEDYIGKSIAAQTRH
jgi:hypothetical protein